MDKFISEQRRLLSLEREAELEQSRILQSSASVKELCERGVAVQRLVVQSQVTGLYGRLVICFGARVSGQELPAHSISSGDILGLRPCSAQSSDCDLDNVSGVVTKVTSVSVSVAFSETWDHLNLDESLLYTLVKLANDITHKRLSSALDSLSSSHSAVVSVLFGVSTPGVPHQTVHPALVNSESGDINFFNQSLDSSQREAVEFCLKQREVGVVHGPPGTGKTTTVVEIIRQSVQAGDKVLVCAPSNVAVDNLLERLVGVRMRVVRLGHPARISDKLQQHCLDAIISSSEEGALVRDVYRELDETLARNRGKERRKVQSEVKSLRKEIRMREKKALKEILSGADVVLGTLTSSGPDSPLQHLPDKHFNLTIIDECSQSLETACWIVASSASKLLLAGDHLQLPPTILSTEASQALGLTLMERLVKMYGDQVTRMLTVQYRMNRKIMQWSSDALYDGKLTAGDSVKDHCLAELDSVEDDTVTRSVLILVDTAGCDMEELTTEDNISKANEGEAAIVYHHVEELVNKGVAVEDIAVVTPYNLQVDLLRQNMRDRFPGLEIKSVDGYQGREKEVVILSLVRSNENKTVGFLAESRRLNVAVTRARRQLIVVCDTETVKSDDFLGEFVEYMEKYGELRTADMYDDLPTINRPDGMILASSNKDVKDDNTSEKTLKDKTKIKSKPTRKPIQPKKSQENTKIVEENAASTIKTDVEVDIDETEDNRRDEYIEELEKFVKSKENFMTFSTNLNSYERRLIHEISEEFDLIHESIGEGNKRYIMISKKTNSEKKKRTNNFKSTSKNVAKSVSDENITKQTSEARSATQDDPEKVEVEAKKSVNVECNSCGRSIPKSNIELHKLRCSVIAVEAVKNTESVKKPKKKKEKKKKESTPVDDVNGDDEFDTLCEQFQKLDKVCNFPKCKVLVATIGVNCKFCMIRFCLSHSMAEIHGCGDEARKAARQQITREGRLVPGSGLINHKPDKDKRAQLEKKLEKKLGEKNSQRQRKKKE